MGWDDPGDYPLALRGLRATDPLGTALPLGAATGTLTVLPSDPPAVR
jgi:hypothetical protein